MRSSKRCSLGCLVLLGVIGETPAYGQATPVVPMTSGDRVHHPGLSQLGGNVCLDGDNLLLGFGDGQPYSGGAAAFHRNPNGDWVFERALSGFSDSGNVGISIAIDGSRAILGAPFGEVEPDEFAFIWERTGTSWQQIGTIVGAAQQVGFGSAVDICGDTAVVSIPQAAALIYHYDGSAWNQQGTVTGDFNTVFGFDLAIDGDVVVVGDFLSVANQLVISRRNGTTWSTAQTLSVSDMGGLAAQGYTQLGLRVALDGDTLLAMVESPDPMLDSGVCVLRDLGSGFVFVEALFGSDTIKADGFGHTIDLDGDSAVISAPGAQGGGAAYLFTRSANSFTERIKYVSSGDGHQGESPLFGIGVAISGESVAFGAFKDVSLPFSLGVAFVRSSFNTHSTIQALCAGNGNAGPACANCPCGNNAPSYSFGGCSNFAGTSAVLAMTGEASLVADTMRMEVSRAMPNSFAVLISSATALPLQPSAGCPRATGVPSLVFDGLRCVGGVTLRHGLRATDSKGRAGDTNDGWGGPFAPAGGLVAQGAFASGQHRFLQAVYRDLADSNCDTGLNTTNAIAVMVIP